MTDRQRLYGLNVESDVDLHQDRPVSPGGRIDVRIRAGNSVARVFDQPAGRTLVHLEYDEPFYTFVERPDGSQLLRFYRSCEFEISPDFRDVALHPIEGREPGIEVVLATGALLAYQLYRRRRLVLHASAVDLGGRALAFVGNSGMGKSTLAALMCAGGADLITDDVLAVDVSGRQALAGLGATELRLRKGADTLADRFAGSSPGRRRSADDREVLRLPGGAADRLPLHAIVIPQPDPESDRVVVQRLDTKDALFALLNFPRILGWQDSGIISDQFAMMSAMVLLVPVIVARVPWGPPFANDLAAEVLASVDAVI